MKGFRARPQKSGKTWYYYDTLTKPRREIPLGSDYVAAVRKWSELAVTAAPLVSNFKQLADEYERAALPGLAKSTQATQRSDIKLLREFFCTPTPAPLDQIKPTHIHALLVWRRDQPTTANRIKRLFGRMFNLARQWGYTEAQNPTVGIKGHELSKTKRNVYIKDAIYLAVWEAAGQPLRDAMDLAYLAGQRPGDSLKMTERDIDEGHLCVKQNKTRNVLRVTIEGELAALLDRIKARKATYKVWSASLIVNTRGMPMTKQTLRTAFADAKAAAMVKHPAMADAIGNFWFVDLRKKASSDVQKTRNISDAADLLGHGDVRTTQANYSPLGKTARPTK